jgi:hypothetical protein
MNKKPSFIANTQEVKSSVPELTGTLTIKSVEPIVTSWGAEQNKITADCPDIGQYPVTFWIAKDKPVNQGDVVPCTFRRRRLQQDQSGNLKAGHYPDGKMITWAWDWEIMGWNVSNETPVQPVQPQVTPPVQPQPQPVAQPQPQPVVQQEVSQEMPREMVISRTAMLKSLMENHSKPVDTWDRDDIGQALVMVAELVKVIYDEWA